MDAAASHANALLPVYCTEEGKFEKVGTGKTRISSNDGLLAEAWRNERVFCNPPYDDILPWVQCANTRVADVAVLLLPPSIDTEWFDACWPRPEDAGKTVVLSRVTDDYHSILWMSALRAGLKPMNELRFLRKRIRFLRPKNVLWDDNIGEDVPDESDTESVSGDAPRAGNLVVIVYGG